VPASRAALAELGASPTRSSADEVVRRLIALANESGGPYNIACVVADVTPPAWAHAGPVRVRVSRAALGMGGSRGVE
jgi:hypothetical protein